MGESSLLKRLGSYINGRWVGGGSVLAVHNPASGELLARVPTLAEADIGAAVDAAARALSVMADLARRRQWLVGVADVLISRKSELARIITLENGKPIGESLAEVDYAASFFTVAAQRIERLAPRELPERPRGCRWTVFHRPAGVAGLIVPWNFPLAMLAKKLSAAIASGCPSLTKPAPQTPLTCIALFHLLDELDFPAGFVNLLIADAAKVGQVFCTDPQVRIISFTGSTEVGQLLLRQADGRVKRFAMELGGNAPFMVFDDADIDLAVRELIPNKFRVSGQTCVCTNRVLVHESVAERFIETLVPQVESLKVGDGLDETVRIGPLIDRSAFDKVDAHVRDALGQGAHRLLGFDPPRPESLWKAFYPPTILTGIHRSMRLWSQETFGPIIAIGTFKDDEEALAQANDTRYGLAAYLFTRDPGRAERMIQSLHFGHVGLNTGTGPTAEAPFGGVRDSGLGREGGGEGLEEFCEVQVVASRQGAEE